MNGKRIFFVAFDVNAFALFLVHFTLFPLLLCQFYFCGHTFLVLFLFCLSANETRHQTSISEIIQQPKKNVKPKLPSSSFFPLPWQKSVFKKSFLFQLFLMELFIYRWNITFVMPNYIRNVIIATTAIELSNSSSSSNS